MPLIQSSRRCRTCERRTLHTKDRFSGGLGCLLSVATLGLFVPVWLLLGVFEAFRPWRCQACGRARAL